MERQHQFQFQNFVFGGYQVQTKLPFRVIQAPFRKFSKYQRDGHWNQKQRLKYTVFLRFFKDLLEDPERKRNARIYQMMSDMIITRNPNQCRSHHQKMEKYRETISEIIASVTQKYEPRVFREIEEKYLSLIKALLQNSDKYIRFYHQHQNKRIKTRRFNIEKRLVQNQERQVQPQVKVVPLPVSQELPKYVQKKQDKEALRKTAEDYSEDEDYNNESYEEDFQRRPYEAKEECHQNQEYIKAGGEFAEKVPQLQAMKEKITLKPALLPFMELTVDMSLTLPITLAMNDTSRLYYNHQLKQLQFQKQWHMQNAKHLMMQWNTQIEAIKLCEQKIKFLRDSFSQKKMKDEL